VPLVEQDYARYANAGPRTYASAPGRSKEAAVRVKPFILIGLVLSAIVAMGVRPALASSGSKPKAEKGSQRGESQYKNPPSPICSTEKSLAPNVNTDCEAVNNPHNETAIAVNPLNPLNMIASANDYQLKLSQGGSVNETVFSRAHVTFDGGKTWTTYPVPFNGYSFTGDPTVAFDDAGTAYLGALPDSLSNVPDIVVSHSTDGGKNWSKAVLVAKGKGSFYGKSLFNDHPILTAWGDGNVLVTWEPYYLQHRGADLTSVPVADAVSHDGGNTWTDPAIVSGSAPFCVGLTAPDACDQTWGNAVAVSRTPGGVRVLVTFYNTYQYTSDGATNLGRDTHMVVRVDPATGERMAGPYEIGLAYDGINEQDYPVNVNGRQTLQDSELRLLHQGNIAADPTDPTGRHFAVLWFDDRNAPHPVNPDPYQAVTNADVIVSQTFDGGGTWSSPSAIARPNDQFFPWAAYDSTGRLRVGFFDRSYDFDNHLYGYTVATETSPGSLSFSSAQATTALSDPTQGDRWFHTTVDPDFPDATRFDGDYSGIAVTPDHVAAYWTDMRETACFDGVCEKGENTYFALMP
jgi:hypothetical protein